MLISPIFVYLFITNDVVAENRTIFELMGIRSNGFYMAFVTPILLTAILFLGPLSTQAVSGDWKLYAGKIVISF